MTTIYRKSLDKLNLAMLLFGKLKRIIRFTPDYCEG